MGPRDSISYRLMRLKKDFLKIHFSNYACSVARVHPSDMPAKTPGNLGRTNGRTIQLSPTDFKGASRNQSISTDKESIKLDYTLQGRWREAHFSIILIIFCTSILGYFFVKFSLFCSKRGSKNGSQKMLPSFANLCL